MEISGGNKVAILCGGTGLIGSHIVHYLLSNNAYSKIVHLGRKKLAVESDKLVQYTVDFGQYVSYAPLLKGHDLYICLGTTMAKAGDKESFKKVDYTYVMNIAKAALDNGVNQILLVSSVGANPNSRIFYNQVKGELERDISKLNFWSVHIFQPSILLGERPESRFGESVAKVIGKGLDFVLGGLLTKYKPVEADVVAKAMVNVAQKLEPGIHVYPSHFLQGLADEEDKRLRKHGLL